MSGLMESHAQEAFPNRPIRVVVPYAPGGTTDILARLVTQKMSEQLKQQVVIENKPGAGTIIGAQSVATAPADGYTLLMAASSTLSVNPFTYKKLSYKVEDFAPVSLVGKVAFAFSVTNSIPVQDLKGLVAYAKQRSGALNYGNIGLGSSTHLFMKKVEESLGIRMQDVTYKGSGPALMDLVSGQIQVYADGVLASAPFHQNKQTKIVAVSSEKRLDSIPDAPTFAELGYPELTIYTWYGIVAPAATPKDRIAVLNAAIVRALSEPDVQERIARNGATPQATTPEDFAKTIADSSKVFGEIARKYDFNLQ
ncbi:MAG: Bug family tripartite tricarboxylate transporter substrate binding protein [Lautropia sp.]